MNNCFSTGQGDRPEFWSLWELLNSSYQKHDFSLDGGQQSEILTMYAGCREISTKCVLLQLLAFVSEPSPQLVDLLRSELSSRAEFEIRYCAIDTLGVLRQLTEDESDLLTELNHGLDRPGVYGPWFASLLIKGNFPRYPHEVELPPLSEPNCNDMSEEEFFGELLKMRECNRTRIPQLQKMALSFADRFKEVLSSLTLGLRSQTNPGNVELQEVMNHIWNDSIGKFSGFYESMSEMGRLPSEEALNFLRADRALNTALYKLALAEGFEDANLVGYLGLVRYPGEELLGHCKTVVRNWTESVRLNVVESCSAAITYLALIGDRELVPRISTMLLTSSSLRLYCSQCFSLLIALGVDERVKELFHQDAESE